MVLVGDDQITTFIGEKVIPEPDFDNVDIESPSQSTESYLIYTDPDDDKVPGYAHDDSSSENKFEHNWEAERPESPIFLESLKHNRKSLYGVQIFACNVTVGGISSDEIHNQDDAECIKRCLPEAFLVEQLKPIQVCSDNINGRTSIYVCEVKYHIFYPPDIRTSCNEIQDILIEKLQQKFRAQFGNHVQVKMVMVIDVNDQPQICDFR